MTSDNIPIWINKFIGIPFVEKGRSHDGVDCWGLVCLIYSERFKIELPDYTDGYPNTKAQKEISALVEAEAKLWQAVERGKEQLGDVVLFAIYGATTHVGMVVESGWMVSAEKGIDSVLESYTTNKWKQRVRGFFRHKDMNGKYS